MKRTVTAATLLTLLVLAASGCVTRLGDFTVISTRNVEIGAQYVEVADPFCEGSDLVLMILSIPLGTPNIENSIDNCLRDKGGDLMTNAVVNYQWYWFVIAGQMGYTVEGDVWQRAGTSDLLDPDVKLFRLESGPEGMQLVSEDDASQRYSVYEPGNPDTYTVTVGHASGATPAAAARTR